MNGESQAPKKFILANVEICVDIYGQYNRRIEAFTHYGMIVGVVTENDVAGLPIGEYDNVLVEVVLFPSGTTLVSRIVDKNPILFDGRPVEIDGVDGDWDGYDITDAYFQAAWFLDGDERALTSDELDRLVDQEPELLAQLVADKGISRAEALYERSKEY